MENVNKLTIEEFDSQCSVFKLWEFTEENLCINGFPLPMYWTSESRIHSRKRDGKVIVAMRDGKLVGCLIANKSEIEILCVKKRYRKKGIGKILVQHVENEWKNDKRRKSIIACSLKNFKAKKFYEKMGFEVENKKEWLNDYSWHFRKALR